MRAIRSRDTKPEKRVRSLLHAAGYRYRLHSADLPGKPDIVFRSRKAAIFIHGCFWHGHACQKGRTPRANNEYWRVKLTRNAERDSINIAALHSQGWHTLIIWECETKDLAALHACFAAFIGTPKAP
jgi:DNA mismatch endonuclease (patch repair protein)